MALTLLTLALFASMPAARADPRFTLEDVTTWQWDRGAFIYSVGVGDVTDDGQNEIVTGGKYLDPTIAVAQLAVWDGATLTFEGVRPWHWESSTVINSIAVEDVDGDGDVEIVTGGWYWDGTRTVAQLCVWSSSLILENAETWYWTGDTYIWSVAVGDVDGDGQKEIVTGGKYYDGTRDVAQLCVWSSSLTLEYLKTWHWTGDITSIRSVAVWDVDGDGQNEIVTGGWCRHGTRMVAQLCVWARSLSLLVLEDFTTWSGTSHTYIDSVAVGDVDGDGSVEIVTGGYYFDDGTLLVAQLAVWNGATLALEDATTWYWTANTWILSVAFGDVDGDGSVEIVTGGFHDDGTRYRAQLCVWSSSLDLEGAETWHWVGNTKINSVACADVDGDGSVEIVTGGEYSGGAGWVAQLCVWGFT